MVRTVFSAGLNNETFQGQGGGSSSRGLEHPRRHAGGSSSCRFEDPHHGTQIEEYAYDNVGMEASPPRHTSGRSAGAELALNGRTDDHISSSENSEEFEDVEEDDSEDGDEEIPGTNVIPNRHHVPTVS